MQSLCDHKCCVSVWAPHKLVHLPSRAALTFSISQSWEEQKVCHRIFKKRLLNSIKQEMGIKISKVPIMPISRVGTIIKKLKIRGSVETKPHACRPTNISAPTCRKNVCDGQKNPSITSADIQDSLKESGVAVQGAQ